ncbi:hypothetical protein E1B28_002968 [Marasmius oreades]|uniref:Nephrocystin 3-like N-terminal domain-containing protein n=1 Tax=Marasmius oreades TaxID=181124 RepID=A0A9P7RKM9_9AGAR|nr:uncharacterized protein E1B28_002968 [Marasmius oreades]KAG7085407.1 hypothetical protein E1B28_002968 [Marasmius oreades]
MHIRRLRPSHLKPPSSVELPRPPEHPSFVEPPRPLEHPTPLEPPRPPSTSQHILNGAQNTTIGTAVFNNVAGDQVQNHNYYFTNLLWEAIKDVGASHNSEQQVDRGHCLPGTRKAVLKLIQQWRVSGCKSMPVCWLSGAAGVGKSAIALTVAEECERDGLVASFFFFRSDPKRNNPSSLILSIVHGVVVKRPHLKALINEKIAADPGILTARLENQYKELVLENLDHPTPPSSGQRLPNLVIIDGLDECGNAAMQRRVLSIIFSTYRQPFSSPLRFFICSRPEAWIQEEFNRFSGLIKHIKLDDSLLPRYDIELYLHQQFQEIRRDPKYSQVEFPDPWPSRYHFRLLVDKSDGQFIFATTTTMFIKADYSLPTDQLCIVVDTISNQPSDSSRESPFDDLDKLYLMILRANPDRDKRLLPILAMIVVIRKTSPGPRLIELVLGYSPGTVAQTLRAMHSVLDVRDRDKGIKIYHTSFTDFLLDPARSREFYINKSEWVDFLACRWTRALTECRKHPELLRYPNGSSNMLVGGWDELLAQVHGRMSSALMLELDAFYHVALSTSVKLVGREVLLHVLAAILLLPYGDPRSSEFIQLFLGISKEVLDQTLQSMHGMIRIPFPRGLHHISIKDQHSTFRDFLLDRERSKGFFIDKGSQSNFLALRSLRLLQIQDESLSEILLENWTRICRVDSPMEELMLELYRMDLGALLAKSLDHGLDGLFCDFKTISTWLNSRTNSITPPDLIDRFKNVQRGFHIRSTRQDVDSGHHYNVITMIILSIVKWTWSTSYSRPRVCASLIMRNFVDYRFESLRALVSAKLSAEFCGCSEPAFDSNCLSTPLPDKTDLYHINIPAGCAQIFKVFVADLKARRNLTPKEYWSLTDSLLVRCPNLLTRCLPLPEILPLFQTVLDIAKRSGQFDRQMKRGYNQDQLKKESRDKLLSWLENFPADCANEVETARNKLLYLMPLDE